MGQNSLRPTDDISPQLADYFRVSSETAFDLELSNTKLVLNGISSQTSNSLLFSSSATEVAKISQFTELSYCF